MEQIVESEEKDDIDEDQTNDKQKKERNSKRKRKGKCDGDGKRVWGWRGNVTRREVNLWIGIGETNTSLHYDQHHGLLSVIRGRKTVFVAPPCLESGSKRIGTFSPLYSQFPNHLVQGNVRAKHMDDCQRQRQMRKKGGKGGAQEKGTRQIEKGC